MRALSSAAGLEQPLGLVEASDVHEHAAHRQREIRRRRASAGVTPTARTYTGSTT
jgi:hypothetical protein